MNPPIFVDASQQPLLSKEQGAETLFLHYIFFCKK